jgi:hypothetical protein
MNGSPEIVFSIFSCRGGLYVHAVYAVSRYCTSAAVSGGKIQVCRNKGKGDRRV